ncbi:hypothetical protein IT411_00015 [Candidatus Peregrinibacteria bacterium]|nr:hypothetical protein [Candidatus Peregrinibacteria bacterium]
MEKPQNVILTAIDSMQITDLLKRHIGIEIFAVNQQNGHRVQLLLNRGELVCKDGLNIKIFDQRYRDYLLETDLEEAVRKVKPVEREAMEVSPAVLPAKLPETNKQRLGWAYWAGKVPSLPATPVARAAATTKRKLVEVLDTRKIVLVKCALPVSIPGMGFNDLAETYLDLIWETRRQEKEKQGPQFTGVIRVISEIRNFPRLITEVKNKLEEEKEEALYRITGDQKGYMVAKLEVEFDYSPQETEDEDIEYDDIPY